MRRFAYAPALLVAAALAFGAVLLGREWQVAAPQVNDSILHERLAEYAALYWNEHWPVDFWFPEVSAGFPMFAHYPHLSHLTAAALAKAVAAPERAARVYETLRILLLVLTPLSIFVSLRHMRLDDWMAAFAALLYTVLASRGNFGIGWDGAVWRTSGLGPQVWGVFLFFPAVAWGYGAVRHGRSVLVAGGVLGLCFLSHFLYGYMAALSLALLLVLPDRDVAWRIRLTRLVALGIVAGAATAYFIVPFALNTDVLLHSRWEPQWKWDSRGWGWLIERLGRGEIFDAGNVPALSLLVGLGVVVALARARRDATARWIVACFALWLVLLTGRAGIGGLADLLPLSGGLHMHRFIGAVQAFGLMLAGLAVSACGGFVRRRPGGSAAAIAVCAVALALLLAAPLRQQIAFQRKDVVWALEHKEGVAHASHLHDIMTLLHNLPPGRVHAGFHGTWGKEFKVAYAAVYDLLQAQGFDMVGYLFMAMARPGEWQVRLDYRRREHCDLFNLRYVVAPRSLAPPPFARSWHRAADSPSTRLPLPVTSPRRGSSRCRPTLCKESRFATRRGKTSTDSATIGCKVRGPPSIASSPSTPLRRRLCRRHRAAWFSKNRVAPNIYEARVAAADATDLVLKVDLPSVLARRGGRRTRAA